MTPDLHERLARELVRAVRGRRSQADASRRAGYRSNMVQRWESGECAPTTARFFRYCERHRVDVGDAIGQFYGRPPEWVDEVPKGFEGVAARMLSDHKGKTKVLDLARRTGFNRYSLGRWLRGQSDPRLPEFLRVLDAASHRLLDFVALLAPPTALPSVSEAWTRLERARRTAYDMPWSHAVLRALELDAYRDGGYRRTGFLGRLLGCDEATVARALLALEESGQVVRDGKRFRPREVVSVNTGRDVERARQLKATWGRVALERLERGAPGLYGYSVFAVSRRRLRRLRELQLEYVRAMEALIAEEESGECVGLYCVQLLDLDEGARNALRPSVRRTGGNTS